jgi:hypothetical protein
VINLLPEELRNKDVPAQKTPADIKLHKVGNGNGAKPQLIVAPRKEEYRPLPVEKPAPNVQPPRTEKPAPSIKSSIPVKREIVGASNGSVKKTFFGLFAKKTKLTMDLLKIENEAAYRQNFFELLAQMARVAFVFAIIFSLLFVGAKFYKSNILNAETDVNKQLALVKADIKQYESSQSDFVKISKRFSAIKSLLDQHIYWGKFFDNLEASTLPGVRYGELVATTDGKVTLSATADNYAQLALQLKVFQSAKDFVKKVEINSGSLVGGKTEAVSFQVALELADKFLTQEP